MSLGDGKNVLVFVEVVDGAPVNNAMEALGLGHELAQAKGEEVCAVVIGPDLDAAAEACAKGGADKVFTVAQDAWQLEAYASILGQLIEKYAPALVLAAANQNGKDLEALLADRFNTVAVSDLVGARIEDGALIMTTPLYGGGVWNDVKVASHPKFATVRSGTGKKVPAEEATSGEIVKEDVSPEADLLRTKIADTVKEVAETVNLEEAEIVVVGGRGMGSKENFKLVHDLADVLGGVVGGTRPVVEDEWVPHPQQVGQSGKIVSPKFYVGCGVSGATQHLTGILGSDFILAINKDEEAPIFDVADCGIVGDVNVIIPLLMDEFKKAKQA